MCIASPRCAVAVLLACNAIAVATAAVRHMLDADETRAVFAMYQLRHHEVSDYVLAIGLLKPHNSYNSG